MEDSSTNPFIPGSSDQLQRKVTRPQTAFARISKTILIVTGILFVLTAIALIILLQNTEKVDEKARADLASALQPTDQLAKFNTVGSDLGFTVSYQDKLFTSFGEIGATRITARSVGAQTSGETYENNDLKIKREYGLVRITPIESSEVANAAMTLPPELEINAYDKAALLQTDEQKAAEAESKNPNETKGELALSTLVAVDTKKRLGERTSDDGTIVSIEATKPARVDIEGVQYQKVRYTTKNENYQVTTEKFDDCYYTIQNSQPYSACVTNIRPNSLAEAALLEDTIRFVSYTVPDIEEDAAASVDKAETAGTDTADDGQQVEQLTIAAPYSKEPNILKAIAKNQPGSMRIGTLYCANLELKQADGSTTTTISDACASKVATGAFISADGYVATTGHAVRFDPEEAINGYINFAKSQDEMLDRLQLVLDYLLKSRLILETSADYLKQGAQTGNQDALAKIEVLGSLIPKDYVQATSENYSYALQLTEKPIVVNDATGNKPSFAYSDTVIKAEFAKGEYDSSKYSQDVFDTEHSAHDVALLKASGNFPVVRIGAGDDLKSGNKLVVLGFPALANSNLTADKIINVPVATMGAVEQTFDLDGSKIISLNAPILPGGDGAPVYDEQSALAGFAAYGLSYCPDQQCFGNGTVRSSNDLSTLIDKHNMEIKNSSPISDVWEGGVDAYFAGNYQKAASNFTQAGSMYSSNQWAAKLADLSKSKQGSESDTSLINTFVSILTILVSLFAITFVATAILRFIHLKRLDAYQVGHYGSETPATPHPAFPTPVQPGQPYQQPSADQAWPHQQAPYTPQQPPVQMSPPSTPQVQQPLQASPWVQPSQTPPQVPPYPQPQAPQQPQPPQDPNQPR